MEYITLTDATCEIEISRSKFIAFLYHVEDEQAVTEKLASLRKKYYDSTHICYAFLIGGRGRSCDDGEPSGTAGAPIYEAIVASGCDMILIAVVRYYGGTKLGTGGLVRAYGGAAREVMAVSERLRYVMCDIYSLEVDFSLARRVTLALPRGGIEILSTEYGNSVTLKIAALTGRNITDTISDMTRGNHKLILLSQEYVNTNFIS